MFDTPVDAWYVWLGLSVVSFVVLGVVTALPTAPAPDAPAVAETVDRAATAEYDRTTSRTLSARTVHLGPRRIGLRNDAGTVHATLGYPVVPVPRGTRLIRVLRGESPAAVFATRAGFERAVDTARQRDPVWQPAGDALVVRRLSWGDVDVTLVGTVDDRPDDHVGGDDSADAIEPAGVRTDVAGTTRKDVSVARTDGAVAHMGGV